VNTVTDIQVSAGTPLTAAGLAQARQEAERSRRKLVEVLEEQLALGPDEFVRALRE
jgi:broad specificity phosphatase PhoE